MDGDYFPFPLAQQQEPALDFKCGVYLLNNSP